MFYQNNVFKRNKKYFLVCAWLIPAVIFYNIVCWHCT